MNAEQVQRQLAAHIRDPEHVAGPAGIEPRRLKIYSQLFYNNIENFISNGFPVLRSLYSDALWQQMIRDFLVRHQCHSPYFLEISQEFLLYLQHTRGAVDSDPVFLQELAHYEWVELALDVDDCELEQIAVNRQGDLLRLRPRVSPLAWSLAYQYPVHKIGADFQPSEPSEQATYLVVYRNTDDAVGFMEANGVTARLLELLQPEQGGSGEQVLTQIAEEMHHPQVQQVIDGGLQTLEHLQSLDIILGTVDPS